MRPVSDPEIILQDILENIVLKDNEDEETKKHFIARLINYAARTGERSYLINRIQKMYNFLDFMGFDPTDLPTIVLHYDAILHRDIEEIFFKYLLWGRIAFSDGQSREYIFKTRTNNLMTSSSVLYARIMALTSGNDAPVHSKLALNTSHAQLQKKFGISKDEILLEYPFDNNAKREVLSWPVNEFFVNNLDLSKAVGLFSDEMIALIASVQDKGKIFNG